MLKTMFVNTRNPYMFQSFLFDHPQGAICRALCRSVHHDSLLIKKVQLDATVCRHLFTAKSLHMFRASQHPSSGVLKTVTATSGIGHNTGTATSFRVLSRPRWNEVAVPVL